MEKPDWWPRNPYPATIFQMSEEEYLRALPDPKTRTSVSGLLGREFWEIASEAIFDAWQAAAEQSILDACEQCVYWDEDDWACQQEGVRVHSKPPRMSEPHRAVGYVARGKARAMIEVGPLFGCVHWKQKP